MLKRIIVATSNEGKIKEIEKILEINNIEILSLQKAGIEIEIVEDGQTFEENAIIKAKKIHALTGELTIADDSGLEIDFLNKEPGVKSARYLGEDTSYAIKNQHILSLLKDVEIEDRTARFVCSIAAVLPNGEILTTRGTIEGIIGHEIRGKGGFGYDPIFFLPEKGVSTAELSLEEKNKISHRGLALKEMRLVLANKFPEFS